MSVKGVDKAPTPLLLSNHTDQGLQHQAIYSIEPLDRFKRLAYTKSAGNLAIYWGTSEITFAEKGGGLKLVVHIAVYNLDIT